jgi:isopenicillin N synthase-like dioxygenase
MEDHSLDLEPIDMTYPRETITHQIFSQMTGLGFLLLKNVPNYDEQALFAMTKQLFSLPLEAKRRLYRKDFNPENKNMYRGYAPFIDNDVSHKELYEIGLDYAQVSEAERAFSLHEESPFPSEDFRLFMNGQYKVLLDISREVMSHIAEGLGKPPGFFDQWVLENSCSTFRFAHYLPRSAQLVDMSRLSEAEMKLTTPEHVDTCFMTLLSTFGYPGLQVETSEGVFKSILPKENTLVVNLGDILSRITGGLLKATKHRVVDIGVERFSCPFFLEPCYLARIPSNLSDKEAPDFIYGEYCIEKNSYFGEYKNFEKTVAES